MCCRPSAQPLREAEHKIAANRARQSRLLFRRILPASQQRALGTVRIIVGAKPSPANSSELQATYRAVSRCTISAQMAASVSSITNTTAQFVG
jgi:GTP cyclohydrolase FolE2